MWHSHSIFIHKNIWILRYKCNARYSLYSDKEHHLTMLFLSRFLSNVNTIKADSFYVHNSQGRVTAETAL